MMLRILMKILVLSKYCDVPYEHIGFEAIFPFLVPQVWDPNPGKRTNGKVPYVFCVCLIGFYISCFSLRVLGPLV